MTAGPMDDDGPRAPVRPLTRRSGARGLSTALATATPEPGPEGATEEEDDPERVMREHVAEMQRRRALTRLHTSGIPPKWQGLRWEELDTTENAVRAAAVKAAERWATGVGERGILIAGPVGTGKTRIVATAAFTRLTQTPLRWLSVAELLMELSLPFGDETRERAVKRLNPGRGDVALVLDDLDKVRPTDHAVAPLYLAINAWVDAEQPLAVTMNRTLDQLADDFGERFGDPIASRLAEHCEVFELAGRDRRVEP